MTSGKSLLSMSIMLLAMAVLLFGVIREAKENSCSVSMDPADMLFHPRLPS